MTKTLVSQLFEEEMCSDRARNLLEIIQTNLGKDIVYEYNFNRFELEFRFSICEVSIFDIIDSGSNGEQIITISDFTNRLTCYTHKG